MATDHTRNTYVQLMLGFSQSVGQDHELRWAWLMAAHIVGQQNSGLHWRSHIAMLRFALKTRDYPEAAGQLMRLSLVPLGHLAGRLPAGNHGRATVSAFTPMPVDPSLGELISQAHQKER
ncbi:MULTISPECIES: DUF3703 domain-containing protein [unclassified Polaromonas]|uniref:DUF3703 domain-containing protein n=1 Tax=unclassified Polaromonas TaxID=2638319 RepID=UPI000F08F87B|nr:MULTISPECIES: DUF3703 domain-containing protein [unclassified Polaromonas]AYQ27128.1 DUF3703 domain-containing protein [Polaromonas sp. SP1]QGJ18026.1 DUF3703 domain-containing protein [Polaromonas sp. Pch-P]